MMLSLDRVELGADEAADVERLCGVLRRVVMGSVMRYSATAHERIGRHPRRPPRPSPCCRAGRSARGAVELPRSAGPAWRPPCRRPQSAPRGRQRRLRARTRRVSRRTLDHAALAHLERSDADRRDAVRRAAMSPRRGAAARIPRRSRSCSRRRPRRRRCARPGQPSRRAGTTGGTAGR